MAPNHAIVLNQVSKTFAGRLIVDRVSLAIGRGEFFSLLGPSGTGKTTVLRLCAGFEQPDDGTIEIDARPMAGVPPHHRPVNTVFQSYALFPHLNVEENIGFGLQMQRVPTAERNARVEEALALLKLESLRRRMPSRLSGGEQQRVAIARAVVNRPSVVLLDEPMAALDEPLRQAMLVELQGIQRRLGTTFVCVTHHQEEALAVSDRVAIMQAGRILQVGTPQEVYERPAARFVAEFLGRANVLSGTVAREPDGTLGLSVEGVARPLRISEATAGGCSPGARATLVVRAECVRLSMHRLPDGAANDLPARIESVRYGGALWHMTLRLAGHVSWSITVPNDGTPTAGFQPGAEVVVHWPVVQSILLPEPSA